MCSLKTYANRYADIKRKMEELKADLDKVSVKIFEKLDEEGLKSFECDDFKITKVVTSKTTYKDDAIKFLKEKAPICVKEVIDSDKLKACLSANVINEKDLESYEVTKTSTSLRYTSSKK